MINFGEVPAGAVLPVVFGTYGKTNGESITLTGLAVTDIEIYKGTSVTQRSSDAGYALIDTDGIDLDGTTGIHGFSIDTGDNTDSGFYAVGSFFTVVVSAVTVDSQTVNFVAATFRIRAAEHTAGYPVGTIKDGTGTGEIDTTSGGVLVAAIANNAITAASINADAITDAKVASDVTIASVTGAVGSVTGAVGSVTGAVGSVGAGGITAASFAANAITAAKLDPDVTTELQAGLATAADLATVAGYLDTEVAAILADTNELQTDWANGGRLDLILDARASQASVDTIDSTVDDILLDTAEIGAAGAGLTNINLPNQTMDIVGNITGNLSGSVGSVSGAVGSVTGNVGGTINGLTAVALKDFFDTDSTTTYASAVAGSVVKEIADNAGGASLTVQDIVDGVWDEAQADHADAGSFGEIATEIAAILVDTGTTLDGKIDTIDSTVDAILVDTAEIGAAGAGLTVLATQASVNTIDDLLDTEIPALTTAVADLPTNAELATALGTADDAVLAAIAALNNLSQANIRTAVGLGSANLDTQLGDLPTNAELATALGTADDAVLAAIAALNNLSAAQVNAEVVDALATDTYAEPTGVPAATASLASKIGRLHEALRNRIDVTATEKTFYNDAGAALYKKSLSDDGTVYTEAETSAP